MEVVDRPEPLRLDLRELQHQRAPADFQHPTHLAQGSSLVGDVAQAEGDRDQVEAGVRERQRFGIELHVAQAAHQPAIGQAVAADAEHRRIDVAEHHLAGLADALVHQRGDIAGAAGQVEHAIAALDARGPDEIALPDPMHAQRHQVVHQVVFAGHGREHLANELLLLADGDVPESEMGLFFHGAIIPVAGFRCRLRLGGRGMTAPAEGGYRWPPLWERLLSTKRGPAGHPWPASCDIPLPRRPHALGAEN